MYVYINLKIGKKEEEEEEETPSVEIRHSTSWSKFQDHPCYLRRNSSSPASRERWHMWQDGEERCLWSFCISTLRRTYLLWYQLPLVFTTVRYIQIYIDWNSEHWIDSPIDAWSRKSSTNTPCSEAIFLEILYIPRLNWGWSKKDAAAHFKGAIQRPCLLRCIFLRGIEPVHRVHHLHNISTLADVSNLAGEHAGS